jgi:hypothetical protein
MKLKAHCRPEDGANPIICAVVALNSGRKSVRTIAHTKITASSSAYHRAGTRLEEILLSSNIDPSADPPKKAASTARTAGVS